MRSSMTAVRQKLLDFADRLGRIQIFRARFGAIHDRVAAIQTEGIFELVEPFAGGLVPAVHYPTIGGQERGGTQVPIAVPPVAGTTGGAARTQYARGGAIDLFLLLFGLKAFAVRRRRGPRLQPRLHGRVLRVEVGQIRDEILDDRHVGQRIDPDVALHLRASADAGKAVLAVDIHGARAANPFTAGAPEAQAGVDLVLDLDERVQNHGAATVHVDLVGIEPRILRGVGVIAVDLEHPYVFGVGSRLEYLPVLADLGILGK